MDAGNTTWIITLESGTPKVEIVRKVSEKPMLECPSERETAPDWDSGLYLSKDKGVRINMIRFIYTLGLMKKETKFHSRESSKASENSFMPISPVTTMT